MALHRACSTAANYGATDADPTLSVSVDAWEPYLERRDELDPAAAMRAAVAVPGVPRDEDGPVFREPWEARAFAMALALHEAGVFTWKEWAATLGDEIKRAQAEGDPDTGETYYRHWLATLEKLVAAKGVATSRCLASLPRRLGPRRRPHAARRADRADGGGLRLVPTFLGS